MHEKDEEGIRSLIKEEGLIEELKRGNLQFSELINTSLILALAINIFSDIIWSIGEVVDPIVSISFKILLFFCMFIVLIHSYDRLAKNHTRNLRGLFRTFEEPIYIDTHLGTIPEISFIEHKSKPLHETAEMHYRLLETDTRNRVRKLFKELDEMDRWKTQVLSGRLFAVLLFQYYLGYIPRVPCFPTQIPITEILPDEVDFLDEKSREYNGIQAPGSFKYKYELDEYGTGILEIIWEGKAKGNVRIAFSSNIRNPSYFHSEELGTILDGEHILHPLEHEHLLRLDVRFEISADFHHRSLINGNCELEFRWAIDLMDELWI